MKKTDCFVEILEEFYLRDNLGSCFRKEDWFLLQQIKFKCLVKIEILTQMNNQKGGNVCGKFRQFYILINIAYVQN